MSHSHHHCWKANDHLISNIAFSSNINPPSSTHLLSPAQSFFFSFLFFFSFYPVTKLCCSSIKTTLIYAFLILQLHRKTHTRTHTHTEECAIFLLRSEWNLCNRKWTTWFLMKDDIIKFIKVAFLILNSAWYVSFHVKFLLKMICRDLYRLICHLQAQMKNKKKEAFNTLVILNVLSQWHLNYGDSIKIISLWHPSTGRVFCWSFRIFLKINPGDLLCVNLGSFPYEGKKNVLHISYLAVNFH